MSEKVDERGRRGRNIFFEPYSLKKGIKKFSGL
jgi:hypothetical protein